MKQALFDAFVGYHFDPLFSSAAAFAGAEDSAALNVPTLHAAARSGIRKVAANAARGVPDATTRILLIDGDAGFGKTHVLTSTLYKLAKDGDVLPAAFQLSADIGEDEVTRRLLRATLRELESRHFPDANGRVPIGHLANGLLEMADYNRDSLDEAVADYDEGAAATEALAAAQVIVRALNVKGLAPPDEHLIAALLLTAERVASVARRWLLGYGGGRVGPLVLPSYDTESDYFDVLQGIAVCAAAVDAPLLLAFDQVEAALAAGSEVLVTRVVTQACQLAELSPSVGIVFSALAGTFPASVLPRLQASIRDRIRHPPSQPIHLKAPDIGVLRTVVDRRCEELARRSGVEPHATAGRIMVPTWLIEQHTGHTIRELFREIREYREVCRALGRFAEASDFSVGRPKVQAPSEDFDKLWENAKDRDAGTADQLTVHERAGLFAELLGKVPDEVAGVSKVLVEQTDVGRIATRVVHATFLDESAESIEEWKIAFTDEPNSQGQFRDQLDEFMALAGDALPAIIRRRPIPGVKEGQARRESELTKLQAGLAITRLFRAGGRAAYAPDQDWARLRLALQFCREREEASGFTEWRRGRRFLLEAAALGEMAELVQPSGRRGATGDGPPEGLLGSRPVASVDARDTARLFLGFAPDKKKVHWNLDITSRPVLPNFGMLVTGDPGPSKTEVIKAMLLEVLHLGCPVLVFDFAGRFDGRSGDDFASDHALTVLDLSKGLPLNPLRLPPSTTNGSQPIEHIFEVAGVIQAAQGLSDQQAAMLRSALELAYRNAGVPLRESVDPDTAPVPTMRDVLKVVEEEYERLSGALLERLEPLEGLWGPPPTGRPLSFDDLVGSRLVFSFAGLPDNRATRRTLAELVLIQLQARLLRGDAPKALRRLLVVDEAWRLADSDRLINLTRKGMAFGVGLVLSSSSSDDLAAEMTGHLATKLHLYNTEGRLRRKVVQSTYGRTSSMAARDLLGLLGAFGPYDAILRNQQNTPFTRLAVEPYHQR